jgi:hypothetical protein
VLRQRKRRKWTQHTLLIHSLDVVQHGKITSRLNVHRGWNSQLLPDLPGTTTILAVHV